MYWRPRLGTRAPKSRVHLRKPARLWSILANKNFGRWKRERSHQRAIVILFSCHVTTFWSDRASNKLLDCLHDAPRQACSDEARDWMREIYRLYLEPEASRKGCHLGITYFGRLLSFSMATDNPVSASGDVCPGFQSHVPLITNFCQGIT